MNAEMFSTSFAASKLSLPTHRVDVAARVATELDLAGLVLLDDFSDVGRHRAGARRRHQAAGPKTLPKGPTTPIMSGAAMQTSKSVQPPLIFRPFRPAHFTAAGGLGLVDLVALGEDDHPQRLANTVGQHDRAADQLVGLLGIDTQPNGDFDRLVELGRVECLPQMTPRQAASASVRRQLGPHGLHAFRYFGICSFLP